MSRQELNTKAAIPAVALLVNRLRGVEGKYRGEREKGNDTYERSFSERLGIRTIGRTKQSRTEHERVRGKLETISGAIPSVPNTTW